MISLHFQSSWFQTTETRQWVYNNLLQEIKGMATKTNISDLEYVIEKLGLNEFFPARLSRNDLYQITTDSISQDKSKCSPVWQFLYNITRYNYQARNIKCNENDSTPPSKMGFRERLRSTKDKKRPFDHPLDVISAVTVCCDPIARQDLSMHLWGCKLAVTFSLQADKSELPSVYIWPLRSLTGQFQEKNSVIEMPLIKREMYCIAMVRVGNNSRSKSFLLNCLIGGPEKAHPIFFHRNSEGSKRTRSKISEGLIEIGWYLSSDGNSTRFDGSRCFLNLRGNAEDLKAQRQIIGRLASVTIVLTTLENMVSTKDTITDLLRYGSRVLLLISDPVIDVNTISVYLEENFSNLSDSEFEVVTVEELMLSELLEVLYYNINKLEMDTTRIKSFSDLVKTLPDSQFDIDEANESYARAFDITNKFMLSMEIQADLDRKETLLPLQEIFWKDWSIHDRDLYRYDQLEPTEGDKYMSKRDLEKRLKDIRENQFNHFVTQGLSEPMKIFIIAISQLDENCRKIFLRLIKLELDNLSRIKLKPLYDDYQRLLSKTIDAPEEERGDINDNLNKLDVQMSKMSFGLEHIIREMGQVYEACESQQALDTCVANANGKVVNCADLSNDASWILAEGYSIEILDGEACSVPLRWIKSVLNELPSILKPIDKTKSEQSSELRVNIISILGIQSSGKSTFLNTAFGLQFAVSAGRCTRGAFLQLVKVHPELKDSIEADYVLVIDTEGLKSAEIISVDSHKNDNELSTFVIGLADTTVINLMGENATYLHENLPISVHAFLRMNMAGLNPRCTIVHHNVDKRNKDKMLQQGRILESVLNKLTRKACELENIPQKIFRDIIEFSISQHTDYIPALYEGEQPMAPFSIGYSKETDEMRSKLIEFIKNDSHAYTLSFFSNRLENLWCAIKTDRFVYEFRTTLEAEAKLELSKGYSSILLSYIKQLDEIVLTLLPQVTSREMKDNDVEHQFKDLVTKVEYQCKNDLNQFIEKRRKINCFEQWKKQFLHTLENEMEQSREKAFDVLKRYRSNVDIYDKIPEREIDSLLDNVGKVQRKTNKTILECFNQVWNDWCLSLKLSGKEETVLQDTTAALKKACWNYRHLITEESVEEKSFPKFQPSSQIHLNHTFHNLSNLRIRHLQSKMQRIQDLVQRHYKVVLSEIKQRHLPYSDSIPKTIIFKVENFITDQLKKENTEMEIGNQFKIDLLLCTAGSIVNEFQGTLRTDFYLEQIKYQMKQMAYKKDFEHAQEAALECIYTVIESIILKDIHEIIPTILQNALFNSKWKERLRDKRTLLGFCLVDMIETNNDSLIKTYYLSPKEGVHKYLETLLYLAVDEKSFVPEVRTYINSNIELLLKPVNALNEPALRINEILDAVLEKKELSALLEQILRYKETKGNYQNVSIYQLKKNLKARTDPWGEMITSKITTLMLDKTTLDASVTVCANRNCEMLIGCTELCPLCREICIFSKGHPGKHQCVIHRPVYCEDFITKKPIFETCSYHSARMNTFTYKDAKIKVRELDTVYRNWKQISYYKTEPSSIWKWIYANKHFLFKEMSDETNPNHIERNWNYQVDSVLHIIRDIFSIYNFKL